MIKKIFKLQFVTFLGLIAISMEAKALAEVVIITSKDSDINEVSKNQIKKIYLGKLRSLSSDTPVKPIDQRIDSKVRQEFLEKVLSKSDKQIQAYWSVRIFTGRGIPPKVVKNDKEVKSWIKANPNSIGYVSKNAVDPSVKVLLRIP